MSIMIKRIWIVFVLVLVSVLTVGCEDRNPELEPGVDPSQPQILEIWTDSHKSFIEALAREFLAEVERQYVQVKVVEFEDHEQLNDFLIRSMAEGFGPDVIYTKGDWVGRNYGKLLSRDGDETFTPELFRATFVRAANESLIQEGRIYGVPMAVDSLGLFYNEEHILDRLPERNVPGKTWNEIKEDASFLTKQDNSFARFSASGIALGRMDNILYSFDIVENMILQFGGSFFTEDSREASFYRTTAQVDGRPVNVGVEAVNLFTSFADARFKHYSWNEFLAHPETIYKNFEAFAQGTTSMVIGYSGDMKVIKSIIENQQKSRQKTISPNDIRVTFFPQLVDTSVGGTRVVLGKVYAMAVPKTTKNSILSWNFLKFSIRKENLKAFFDETKLPTPRLDMLAEQQVDPQVGIFVRQAKYARSNIFPFFVSRDNIIAGFSKVIISVNEGKGNTDTGLKSLESLVNNEMLTQIKLLSEISPQKTNTK